MRIYLAARYSRIEEMNKYATELRSIGYIVDARWLLGNHQIHNNPQAIDDYKNTEIPEHGKLFAQDDIYDLINSDIVICFSEIPNTMLGTGGRHVELGLALMWNHKSTSLLQKQILLIGPRENVFYCLPDIIQYTTWEDCIKSLISIH